MKRYDVIIDGNHTTLLLSDRDAALRGLTAAEPAEAAPAVESKAAKAPANKARKPANKRSTPAKTAGADENTGDE